MSLIKRERGVVKEMEGALYQELESPERPVVAHL
jgi:hypothetical protein